MNRNENGDLSLSLEGELGQTYVIEASHDLTTWVEVETVTLSGSKAEVRDTSARGRNHRFYRQRVVE